jgi:hypothetical protein
MNKRTKELPIRIQIVALNITVFLAIIAFCVVAKATLADFAYLLFAWYTMVGWVKLASGVFKSSQTRLLKQFSLSSAYNEPQHRLT